MKLYHKIVIAFLAFLVAGLQSVPAKAQSQLLLGLQGTYGVEPRQACLWDTSNTCVAWGSLNSSTHSFLLNSAALPSIPIGLLPTITNSKLAAGAADTVKGSLNGTTVVDMPMTSCPAGSLTYTLGTGFGCVAGIVSNVATAYPLTGGPITSTGTVRYAGPTGAGIFRVLGSSNAAFLPFNGDTLKINGVIFQIPANVGITCSPTSVYVNGAGPTSAAVSTTYWVFLFNNGGTPTCDVYDSAHLGSGHHVQDTTAGNVGVEVRQTTGSAVDPTRTLIGMMLSTSGPAWQVDTNGSGSYSSSDQRLSRSWYNDPGLLGWNIAANSFAFGTLAAWGNISASTMAMLVWNTDQIDARATAYVQTTGSTAVNDYAGLGIGIDGISPSGMAGYGGQQAAVSTFISLWAQYITQSGTLSEGYHTFQLLAYNSGHTYTYNNANLIVRTTRKNY